MNGQSMNNLLLPPPWGHSVSGFNDTQPARASGPRGRFIQPLLLGLGLLGLFPSAFGQGKALYYDGLAYEFMFQNYNSGQNLSVQARFWSTSDNAWDLKWFQDWGIQPVDGSLGACVFKGSLYCFFTTPNQMLEYVTIDPVSQHMTGP